MPIFQHGYRRYQGEFTNTRLRWWPILRTGVTLALRSKLLKRMIIVAHLPVLYFGLVFLAIGKVTDPSTDLDFGPWADISSGLLGNGWTRMMREAPTALRRGVGSVVFSSFGGTVQLMLVGLTAAVVGPPLIARDMGSRAFLLYFSRPISFADYILGKAGALVVLLAAVTLSPNVLLYALSIVFSPSLDTLLHTLPILIETVLATLVMIVPAALVMLTLSSLVTQPRFAAAAWAIVLVFGLIFHNVLRATGDLGDSVWPRFFSLAESVRAVELWIHNVPSKLANIPGSERLTVAEILSPPAGGAQIALYLLVVCLTCVAILYRRVSAPTRV